MRPNHVRISNLGILIHLKDSNLPDLLAPAFLYSDKQPTTPTQYTLYMVAHRKILRPRCQIIDSQAKSISPDGQKYGCQFRSTMSLDSSEPFRVDIAADKLPAGLVTVHVSGDYENNEAARLSLDVHFIHEKMLTGAE